MLVILVGYWLLAIAHGARPIARTEYGPVEGIEMETYGRRKIYGFFNIPYTEDVNSRRRFEVGLFIFFWHIVVIRGTSSNSR